MATGKLKFRCVPDDGGIDLILGVNQTNAPLRVYQNDERTLVYSVSIGGTIVAGGQAQKVNSFTTTPVVMLGTYFLILVDATAGAAQVNLQNANINTPNARIVRIVKIDSSSNPVSIHCVTGDKIAGWANTSLPTLQSQFSSVDLISDAGTTWYPLGPFNIAAWNLKTVTATYGLNFSDYAVLADTTSAAFTITLLSAAAVPAGYQVKIEKIDDTANGAVTIARAGADTIEGSTSITLTNRYDQARLTSDGVSTWYRL